MRRLLAVLLFLTVLFGKLDAQVNPVSQFLFDDYQETLILYKDGRQFAAPVNFDLLEGHFLFIDAKDKQPKQFANPEMIALLRVGSRCFLLGEGEAVEVLQAEPLFQVAYSGNLRQAPKSISYGGSTQTAAVDTYVGYSGGGGGTLGSKQQSRHKMVVGINKNYKCEIGSKTRRFYDQKTFLKAFPKERRMQVEEYISQHEIDFGNVQQVYELYMHIQSLGKN